MMLFYRVRKFAKPMGPWRADKRKAQRDAVELGLGDYDEWGRFFAIVPGDIEEVHERFIERCA